MICFPHAGGAVSAFRVLGAEAERYGVEVFGFQYPGRENRFLDPPANSLNTLALEAAASISQLPKPTSLVLLGASMGSLVAVEVLRALTAWAVPVDGLVAVSAVPPHLRRAAPGRVDNAFSRAFAAEARKGSSAPNFDHDPEAEEYYQSILRADLELSRSYSGGTVERFSCSVLSVTTTDDAFVLTRNSGNNWSAWAAGRFVHRQVRGGHLFFLQPAGARAILSAAVDAGVLPDSIEADHAG